MAEHGKNTEAEAGAEGAVKPDAGLAAVALARAAGRGGGQSDPRMDAFLDEQTDLIRLQKEHLHEERGLQHRHGRLKYFGERLKVGLQLLDIMAGVAVAIAIGALVWTAAHANNLIVEAFSVPPALTERGITGEALARQLNDDLAAISRVSLSAEEQRGVTGEWGKSLSVEIPETGATIASGLTGACGRTSGGWIPNAPLTQTSSPHCLPNVAASPRLKEI